MSNPRPIHQLHREIRTTPHESEPVCSYEEDSFLTMMEDDFHNRLVKSRGSTTGSTQQRGGGGNATASAVDSHNHNNNINNTNYNNNNNTSTNGNRQHVSVSTTSNSNNYNNYNTSNGNSKGKGNGNGYASTTGSMNQHVSNNSNNIINSNSNSNSNKISSSSNASSLLSSTAAATTATTQQQQQQQMTENSGGLLLLQPAHAQTTSLSLSSSSANNNNNNSSSGSSFWRTSDNFNSNAVASAAASSGPAFSSVPMRSEKQGSLLLLRSSSVTAATPHTNATTAVTANSVVVDVEGTAALSAAAATAATFYSERSNGVVVSFVDPLVTHNNNSNSNSQNHQQQHHHSAAADSFRRWDSNASNNSSSSQGANPPNTTTTTTTTTPQQPPLAASTSTSSLGKDSKLKKDLTKQRLADRRRKMESMQAEMDMGHIVDHNVFEAAPQPLINSAIMASSSSAATSSAIPHFTDMPQQQQHHPSTSLDRSSSDQSTGSLLYGKTPNSVALGKSSSLIFPTGVDHHLPHTGSGGGSAIGSPPHHLQSGSGGIPLIIGTGGGGMGGAMGGLGGGSGGVSGMTSGTGHTHEASAVSHSDPDSAKRRRINLILDQCEAVRFPFKKKLMLNNLQLTAADIPLADLCGGTPLGNSLHKLSLAGNRLGYVPDKLVQSLPALKHLDLSQCDLHQLPEKWNLPSLKRLNLSHNRLRDFPEEGMLEGIPELQELNMYGNTVAEIIVPHNPTLLSKLETLNLGYNDLAYLPDDLDRLKSLKNLKVMNNFLEKVPMRVCDMDLRTIDVSSNPVIQPPIETCERGICSMKRYYHCLRMEEQSKQRALETVQNHIQRGSGGGAGNAIVKRKKSYGSFIKSLTKPSLTKTSPSPRRTTDETGVSLSSAGNMSLGSLSLRGESQRGDSQRGESHRFNTLMTQQNDAASVASSASGLDTSSPGTRTTRSMVAAATAAAAATSALSTKGTGGPETVRQSSDIDAAPFREVSTFGPSKQAVESLDETTTTSVAMLSINDTSDHVPIEPQTTDQVTVNDTLKVIFVGMAMVGKTSMIKRLIEGKDAVVPTHDERTVGVDIYEWDPKKDRRFEHIDSRIEFQDEELKSVCGDVDVKFSVWDFAGQHVYHATHELFFSQRALYVLVWDMGATNRATLKRKSSISNETGAFKLSYDSSDDEEEDEDNDMNFASEEEGRRADRALERDIDEKVQFWVDCIQSSAPGAAILPVASFADYFTRQGGDAEAKRRCNMLKQRLLKHEERRIEGIEERLKEYYDQNRADDQAAVRLRKLLCPYTRPKLIFGNDEDNSVVRVSGTQYTGFAQLTETIVSIATGRDKGQWRYPIFHGHVGARIPRMRLEVREAVRKMRDRFKVVEWGYLINQLRDMNNLTSIEDISDALHFLTNIGELSYFGGVMPMNKQDLNPLRSEGTSDKDCCNDDGPNFEKRDEDDDMDVDDEQAVLSMDDTSITAPSTSQGSITTVEDFMSNGLSQFVFLNPRWLVAAVACILRHDLDREIKETRRLLSTGTGRQMPRAASFYDAHLNCPVITAEDACMLWQTKRITKKAAERAQEYSNNMTVTPFEFLQLLLIRFGVFVPIDLTIEKAFLGGKEYAQLVGTMHESLTDLPTTIVERPAEVNIEPTSEETALKANFFFLPSLLGPGEPAEAWTYKNTDSWKTTLCHSILFPDGVPPGLMERLTASVLSSIYHVSHRKEVFGKDFMGNSFTTYEGQLVVKEILCWRTAFFVKLGTQVPSSDGTKKESIVEIFAHLAERESHLCVGSDYMGVGMRRLIVSGRGQVGDGGRKIWKGGYLLVCKCVRRVMDAYGGLEYETQGFCTECLANKAVSEAASWDLTAIRTAVLNQDSTVRCRHGHRVDTRLIAGPVEALQKPPVDNFHPVAGNNMDPIVPVQDLLRAVVLVGLWDGKTRNVVRVGSGFIVDRKRGLIVTASHTLMNIWGDQNAPFGENYYGLRQGKIVIGVIPRERESESASGKDMAVFRYFAKIVAKDPSMDHGECHLDACVLCITTRLENDVGGNGDGCGDQPEILLLNNPVAMKHEKLQALKITEKCELEEQVRILGYNQGGEGLLGPGESLNRYVDFARGYVSKKFAIGEDGGVKLRERFKPREEIVVICPTIGGHSGGPCVNQQGEVIGILSRADPAESQRCYISPTYEWKDLIKQAKKSL